MSLNIKVWLLKARGEIMIKLLNKYDIIGGGFGDSKTLNLSKSVSEIIRERLDEGLKKHELIYTSDLRGIGKTYELIKFAKYNNYIVIVNLSRTADNLRKEYDYKYIYSEKELQNIARGNRNRKIVIDECVDFQRIKEEGYYEIVTGFSNVYIDDKVFTQMGIDEDRPMNKPKSTNEAVIENLEQEIKSLNRIITITREKEEYGTYKNLIISLKEVLNLYNSEINKDKNTINPVVNIHVDYSNAKSSQDIIDALKKLPNMAKEYINGGSLS